MTLSSYSLTTTVILSILIIASASDSTLENVMVKRYIDVSTQLVVVNTQIEVMNKLTEPIDNYVYIVDPEWAENLSFIEVLDNNKSNLNVERSSEFYKKIVLQYTIWLSKPLSSGETTHIFVTMILTNYLKSLPKSVKQNEKHTVLFTFNIYYHSLYFSHAQTTYLYMGTAKAALIDGEMYTIANDSKYGFQYGPYFQVSPFKDHQTTFHYENNSPFLVVDKINRFVKLSQWGYISVWDQIQILHTGPIFKGPFERNFFKTKKNQPHDTRIEGFVSTLPRNAFDIYLKDMIGLIWSFNVNYDHPNRVDVSIDPRNILYGGWKTQYEIGYSLPIDDYVAVQGSDEYRLSFPLMDKVFQDMIIKEAEINIILPEGAALQSMSPYFSTENKTDTKFCYYFDVMCREMISFKKHNLVEKHIINLSLVYSFSQQTLLFKPLTIVMYLYLIFIFVIIYSRLDFSTSSEKQVKSVGLYSSKFPVFTAPKKKNRNKKYSKKK